jgi:bacteriocin-like protein
MTDLILREEEPIELTDEELDAVTGGLFNINSGNTGIGAAQGGSRNLNVALANLGIGNISVL